MTGRYAIYFAPDPGDPLGQFGSSWLGRDSIDGSARSQLYVNEIPAPRLRDITASARHYGFHATLKAPFALAPGENLGALHEALIDFAAAHSPVASLALKVSELDGFLALTLTEESKSVMNLAADCVRHFDRFRAPLSDAEVERRRKAPLSKLEDAFLLRWGYPYVMEAFRFHMTLTQRLEDDERRHVLRALQRLFARIGNNPFTIDSIALFVQERRDAPFRMVRRYLLRSGTVISWATNESIERSTGPSLDTVTTSPPPTR